MSDHLNDAVTVLVTLDMPALCRAARLGGLPITLDEHPLDDEKSTVELLRFFAKRGICKAIYAQFEHEYPMHYPDDVEFSDWQTSGSTTGAFSNVWRGKAKW